MSKNVTIETLTVAQIRDAGGFARQYADSGLESGSELFSDILRDLIAGNPCALENDPVAFLGRLNGKVVCQILTMPDELWFHGTKRRWFWGQSFVTRPEARGQGVGTLVIAHMLKTLKAANIDYGAYAMSFMSKKVWEKCGMKYLGRVPRFIAPLNVRRLVQPLRLPPRLKNLTGIAAGASLGLVYKISFGRARHAAKSYRIEAVDEFDHDLDDFIAKHRPSLGLDRSSQALNWRLNHVNKLTGGRKNRNCRAFYMRRADNRLAGYGVFKAANYNRFGGHEFDRIRIGTILDFMADAPAAVRAVLKHAFWLAKEERCDFLEIMSPDRQVQKTFRSLGMFRVGGYDLAFETGDSAVRAQPLRAWRLHAGESDAFFF